MRPSGQSLPSTQMVKNPERKQDTRSAPKTDMLTACLW